MKSDSRTIPSELQLRRSTAAPYEDEWIQLPVSQSQSFPTNTKIIDGFYVATVSIGEVKLLDTQDSEDEDWLKLAEGSFEFWDNEDDAIYDNL